MSYTGITAFALYYNNLRVLHIYTTYCTVPQITWHSNDAASPPAHLLPGTQARNIKRPSMRDGPIFIDAVAYRTETNPFQGT